MIELPEPALTSYSLDSVMRKYEHKSFTADQMRELAARVRAEAIEEAAQLCEKMLGYPPRDVIAQRVRSLINKGDGINASPAATEVKGDASCEHCGGIGEIFGHAEGCTDDLCALNGDHHSCGGRVEPCTCTQPPSPAIPPGCEMARGWAVEVSAQGKRVLVLSDVGYSGLADLDPWESTIRGCAEHLQSFIGPAGGSPAPEPESLETSEADAVEPTRCAVAGCRYALDGQGLAAKCVPGCSIAKEGGKG